jgi:drug/metabolite transporter (DMT)-like permease
LAYGGATVLEQIAAKRQTEIRSLHPRHLWYLLRQPPFLLGLVLDFVGWVAFLITARDLPLYLALAFVALSLVAAAVLARIFLDVAVVALEKLALIAVMIGVVILGVVAQPSAFVAPSRGFQLVVGIFVLPLGLAGLVFLRREFKKYEALSLAVLAGLSFGATGLIAKILQVSSVGSLLHPLTISLAAYGLLGALLLNAALQRENVNRVNGTVFASELALPTLLGIWFLGDQVRPGFGFEMAFGLACVIGGTLMMALETRRQKRSS